MIVALVPTIVFLIPKPISNFFSPEAITNYVISHLCANVGMHFDPFMDTKMSYL